jgi:hypothetical protein
MTDLCSDWEGKTDLHANSIREMREEKNHMVLASKDLNSTPSTVTYGRIMDEDEITVD